MLKIDNISVGYKNALLKTGNISIFPGELIVLIGPNGAGKSTLIHTLMGEISPITGNLSFDTIDIEKWRAKEKMKWFSLVSSRPPEVDYLTIKELVGLGRAPYTNVLHKLTADDHVLIQDALDTLNLAHLADKYLAEVSDGERQLAMIAKALVQETDCILLDEPTAFLDYSNKKQVMDVLIRIAKEKHKMLLLSTHDIELGMQYASSIWAIDKNEKQLLTFEPPFSSEAIIQKVFLNQ
jgi:iron complex transport system ATP-binding protein